MNFFKPKFWDKNTISFLSILLFPVSLIIKLLFFLKIKTLKNKKFNIPIICVGNIYLGGTGKTPLCIEIFSILKNLGKNPAFIKKYYKFLKDESSLQNKAGPLYESKKRSQALKKAIEDKINVAILDDGFQDFSIKKDLSIVCFNEAQSIGNGMTIPSGPLRESLSGLKRADCAVINGNENTNLENRILKMNPLTKIFYSEYVPENIEEFTNKNIICFAGIGNPINFFNLLKKNKLNLLEEISFPDHHNFSNIELENLLKKAKKNDAILLTTEKDYSRINENNRKYINFLKIKIIIKNKNAFIEEIKKVI